MPKIAFDFMLLLHIYLGVIKTHFHRTHFHRKTMQICNFKNTSLEKIHLIQVFLSFLQDKLRASLQNLSLFGSGVIFSGQLGLTSSNSAAGAQFSTSGFQSLCCHSRQQDRAWAGQNLWTKDLLPRVACPIYPFAIQKDHFPCVL